MGSKRQTVSKAIEKVLARARLRAQISRECSERSVAGPVCSADGAEATELVASLVLCSPFLRVLDSEQIRELVLSSRVIRRRRDDVLFAEGDAGSSAFLVLEGAVALEQRATALRARIEPGRVLSVPASTAWLATARAENEVRVLEIPRRICDSYRAARADSDAHRLSAQGAM